MTLTKAHKLVDMILKNKAEKKTGMMDQDRSWNQNSYGMIKEIVSMVVDGLENDCDIFDNTSVLKDPILEHISHFHRIKKSE